MRTPIVGLVALLVASIASAESAPSGPKPGAPAPVFKAFDATGEHEGEVADFGGDARKTPIVYVFIQAEKWDRPTARYLKKLDEAVAALGEDHAIVAVWLTDDQPRTREYLPVASNALQLSRTTFAAFDGDRFGPRDWALDGENRLTAIAVRDGKVVAGRGYRLINETDVAEILKSIKK